MMSGLFRSLVITTLVGIGPAAGVTVQPWAGVTAEGWQRTVTLSAVKG